MSKGDLKFEAFHSTIDPEFWYDFEQKKLKAYKLDSTPKPIYATYVTGGQYTELSSRIRLGKGAFLDDIEGEIQSVERFSFVSYGSILNANTFEEFKCYDYQNILKECAQQVRNGITSHEWVTKPSLLVPFCLVSYADLKQHKFHYWFSFPALTPPPPSKEHKIQLSSNVERLSNEYPCSQALQQISQQYNEYRNSTTLDQKGFFLVSQNKSILEIHSLENWKSVTSKSEKWYLGFADPSALDQYPGWPLRNYLIAAANTFGLREFSVMCLREIPSKQTFSRTIMFDVKVPQEIFGDQLTCVGWEKTAKGKLQPRKVDMGSSMDPKKLAESSVALNIELMKWRMLPSLDVDLLSNTKCLLLGAGTLGCHVARNLLAWKIFNITLVDRTKVSFSNPVRQPLYEFTDCLNGGKPKAAAAVEHLKLIYPNVNASSYHLDIPMPGHPVSNVEVEKSNVALLEKLIDEHDVIFLLTDTRESRWLPTVISCAKNKLVMNAALGFESLLVMRHGMYNTNNSSGTADSISNHNLNSSHGKRLGCYFCNDVIAPVNTTKDRTLDQQCTVTRPGVSAMAGAMAVELLVSILHHPNRAFADADYNTSTSVTSPSSTLGLVPHQIRGSLTTFQNSLMFGVAYSQCTACSEIVVERYKKEGFQFLEQVFNKSSILEEITGLKEMHERTRKLVEFIVEDGDDDGEIDDDDGFDIL